MRRSRAKGLASCGRSCSVRLARRCIFLVLVARYTDPHPAVMASKVLNGEAPLPPPEARWAACGS